MHKLLAILSSIKKLAGDRGGNVLILTAAAMPVLIGSASLAIDTIQLSVLRRHLQRAADSGALAGAYAKAQNQSTTVVAAAVTKTLGLNEAFPLASTPVITHPSTGTHANRAVRVQISATRTLAFWAIFSNTEPTITVEATAALVYTGKYCMISLDEGTATGIDFSGSTEVKLGCGAMANSSGASAITAGGNSAVTASPIAAVGGVPSSTSYKGQTVLLPYSLKQADPYAAVPDPALPSLDKGSLDSGNKGPGWYTGSDVNGTLTLSAGTYYITGPVKWNSKANITGTNVTIIFTSTTPSVQTSYPSISINGQAVVNLTPPTDGDYKSMIMYYDRRSTSGSYHINGGSSSKYEGGIYFPNQELVFNGNADMNTNCIQLVAKKLTFLGNSEISNTCPVDSGAKAFDASWVRLVA